MTKKVGYSWYTKKFVSRRVRETAFYEAQECLVNWGDSHGVFR